MRYDIQLTDIAEAPTEVTVNRAAATDFGLTNLANISVTDDDNNPLSEYTIEVQRRRHRPHAILGRHK